MTTPRQNKAQEALNRINTKLAELQQRKLGVIDQLCDVDTDIRTASDEQRQILKEWTDANIEAHDATKPLDEAPTV